MACSTASAGVARSAAMASTAKPFLSIRNPPSIYRSMMMRVVRMFLIGVRVAVTVLLAVLALVDDFRGDVDRRERGEDERLEKAGEEREQHHGDLDGDPAAERHQLLDDVVFPEDVAVEAQ